MIAETIPQLKKLSTEEKLLLAGELWDEAAALQDEWEPDPEFVAGLQEQLEECRRDQASARSWDQVKANILARR